MFGSTNPFGQSSTSNPFGQQTSGGGTSPFGQSSNPFAPKPFGSPTSPFGAQSSSSIFGGSSTGVFGQPSTPLFGSASTPAFGASSTPAFGAASSSTPAFGSGSSLFGQKPAFGGFGSSPAQSSSPFGSGFQQSQPAFGTTAFGSTPAFGASSTPAFGASSTPAFGASSTPAFGASSTPAFGSTSTSLFGNTTGAFGASTTPAFGASSTPLFGASSTPAFGASSTPAFGASTTPAFGAASTPAFGAASTPSFSFGSTPAFGQTGSTFGSTPFGTSSSPFGAQSSAFGAQTTTPAFGSSSGFGQQPAFGAQGGGSRITPFTPTPEEGVSSTAGQIAKLESISAMPAYKDKSHEELRWEDYQRGDKGGPNTNPVSAFGQTAPTQPSPFGTTGTFGQTAATNPFSSSTTSNPFGPKTSTPTFGSTGFGSTGTPLFGSASSSPFGSSTSFGATTTTPSIFGTPSSAAAPSFSSSSLFGGTSTPAFGSSTFGSGAATGSNPFGPTFGGTQSLGLSQSSTPSFGQTQSPFGQPSAASGFQQTTSAFGSTILNTPSTGFGGNMFSNTASPLFPSTAPSGFGQTNAALSTPFQPAAPAQSSGAFSFGNFGQTQSAGSGGFGFGSTFGQNTFNQPAASQGGVAVQPIAVTNPFGALPAMPTMSIGRVGSTPSVQYGISSMPVAEKPSAGITRTSSMLVPRHLSQRRIKLPPRRYPSRTDGPRVPYFTDEDEVPSTPKADAFLIPRENPRSLILRPIEQWPPHIVPDEEVLSPEDGPTTDKPNGRPEEEPSAFDHSPEHTDRKGGVATRVYNDIEANGGSASKKTTANGGTSVRLPKLIQGDYYTVPRISELEKREREEPGYCRRVKHFVIGREGYGSIMFYEETDVSGLDLDSIVEFGNREVVVYQDESNKPPVGQGLNKAAEVTLLNVKLVNKKTGQQYLEPDRVRKYTEMLKTKSAQQGAHFISYNPVQGEWKFKVDHF